MDILSIQDKPSVLRLKRKSLLLVLQIKHRCFIFQIPINHKEIQKIFNILINIYLDLKGNHTSFSIHASIYTSLVIIFINLKCTTRVFIGRIFQIFLSICEETRKEIKYRQPSLFNVVLFHGHISQITKL